MFIKHLEVENWKCFARKKYFDFHQHELISQRNGTGKTSLFEAILYAIWGKAPIGFNLNTVRYDDKKACRVFISFDLIIDGENKEATIERIFGGASLCCELKIEGVLICESVRSIEVYMNAIINQKITTQLWTSSLINSDITSSNFFTKSVLEDILKDPLKLAIIYKSKIYAYNKKINSFHEKVLDIEEIEKKLEEIKCKLKEKTDGDINRAKYSEIAAKKILELEIKVSEFNLNYILSVDDAKIYIRTIKDFNQISEALLLESKKKESIFSNFNEREIRKIIDISQKNKHCILCGGDFNEDHKKKLDIELSLKGRSEEKIKKLKDSLNFLNKYNKEWANIVIEIESQKTILSKCLNYSEIINNYNDENNKLWDQFNLYQKEYSLALKQQEELKEINLLKVQVDSFKEKLIILDEYIQDASVDYTNKIMEKATQYLSSINSRYKQICLYEGSFHVAVEDENFALNLLPIVRLSGGEKTICALSLLFAIHNIVVPELPLLFDETFSALDVENLEQIQRFLRNQHSQIFIITHDKHWNEF